MHKIIYSIMIVLCLTSCQGNQKKVRIVLTNPNGSITVPVDTTVLELERGKFVYILKKEKDLNDSEFEIVTALYPNKAWWGWSSLEFPEQASAAGFSCMPKGGTQSQQLSVHIYPANSTVREKADQIRGPGTIKVTGMQFVFSKLTSKDEGGIEYPPGMKKVLLRTRIFYVTSLSVKSK